MADRIPQPFVVEPMGVLDLAEINTRLTNVQADFEALFQDNANAQGFLEDDLDALLATLSDGYLTNDSGVLTIQATPIPVADGGTGIASYTVGDLLYASAATTLSRLADVATGNALISGGVATAPNWGKIGLTTHVSGVLPIANGGTNATTTATAGGVAYGTGTAYAFTSTGTSGQILTSAGASAPTWSDAGNGSVDRVIETGTTRTIADTYSLVVADYMAIEGTGTLALEGDAALWVG